MSPAYVLSFILLLLFIALLAFVLPWLEREWRQFYFNRVIWRTRISRQNYLAYDRFFSEKMSYYRYLDESGRAKFIYRVMRYIKAWEFEGREGLEVDLKMKLLVGGAATQLTYGFSNFHLPNFTKVILFPETFHSKLVGAEVKGLTYPGGVVAFSWKDFEEGYRVDSDKLNLGLHEMAHALDLNYTMGGAGDKAMRYYFDEFIDEFFEQFQRLHELGDGYLRNRALTNEKEFFAICVEHFFEAPEEFREKLPDTFNHLCALLQQNPLNREENYRFNSHFITESGQFGHRPLPSGFRFLRKGNISASNALFTLNIPIGFYLLIHYLRSNEERAELLLITALCGAILFFIIRGGAGFLISVIGSAPASLYSMVRGFALTITGIWFLGNHIVNRDIHADHRIKEVFHVDYIAYFVLEDRAYIPSQYLRPSEYPFFMLRNKTLRFDSGKPVVLREHSKRGMYDLVEKIYELQVLADGQVYPYFPIDERRGGTIYRYQPDTLKVADDNTGTPDSP